MCHQECKDKIPIPCVPTKDTPGRKREGAIESYISAGSKMVPKIIVSCDTFLVSLNILFWFNFFKYNLNCIALFI